LNIAVLVKLVPDTEASLKIDPGRPRIAAQDLNFVLNPYDEFAIEEALRHRESSGGSVTLYSLGGDEAVKAIRNGIAMGADEGVQVLPTGGLDMLGTARALAQALRGRGHDLIIAGKQAVDDDCGAIGPMVAAFLGLPHVSTVVQLSIADGRLTAVREIEGGSEVCECSLPALITAQKGLNEPRYASLKGIMLSKKKEIPVVPAADSPARVDVVNLTYPQPRPPGRVVGKGVEAVPELIKLLREEAKVL